MDINYYADQSNWPNTLDDARLFAHEAISNFKWKKKAPEFKAKIDRAKNVKRVQEVVIYALLSGEGNAVIKF